jgi:hypothetical protein
MLRYPACHPSFSSGFVERQLDSAGERTGASAYFHRRQSDRYFWEAPVRQLGAFFTLCTGGIFGANSLRIFSRNFY